MTEEMKARLKELTDKGDALSDPEKAELSLLKTVEKMAGQITEKDTLIGTRATELDTLKRELAEATGEDKLKLEQEITRAQESIDTLRVGIDALKEAQTLNKALAEQISHKDAGHGGPVEPEEIAVLEKRAFASEDANKKVTAAYAELSPEEKTRYKTDLAFKKQCLESALGISDGDDTDDTPWSPEVENKEEIDEDEGVRSLFAGQQRSYRRGPPSSSGRQGAPGKTGPGNKPEAVVREPDPRTQ